MNIIVKGVFSITMVSIIKPYNTEQYICFLMIKGKEKYRWMFESQKVRKHKFRKEWSQH